MTDPNFGRAYRDYHPWNDPATFHPSYEGQIRLPDGAVDPAKYEADYLYQNALKDMDHVRAMARDAYLEQPQHGFDVVHYVRDGRVPEDELTRADRDDARRQAESLLKAMTPDLVLQTNDAQLTPKGREIKLQVKLGWERMQREREAQAAMVSERGDAGATAAGISPVESTRKEPAPRLSPEESEEAIREAARFLSETRGLGDNVLRYGPVGRETTRLIALTRRYMRVGPYAGSRDVPDAVAREVETKLGSTIAELRPNTMTAPDATARRNPDAARSRTFRAALRSLLK